MHQCGLVWEFQNEPIPMYVTFWFYRVLDLNQIAACSPCLKSVLWNTSDRRYLIIDLELEG